MPKIFELFGFPVKTNTAEALYFKRNAICPFMNCECDGGGNRFASNIDLSKNEELASFFGHNKTVPSGVCSIQLSEEQSPWIVCPRRLLVLGRENANFEHNYQTATEKKLLDVTNYPKGTKVGIWSEVKLKLAEISDDEDEPDKSFHYAFDYVLMPLETISQIQVEAILGNTWQYWRKILLNSGYVIVRRGDLDFVEDFPIGTPFIIEIMTSSTSGGNKTKRTTIPQAFEDAILGKPHSAPSINKRQVWARMVSQLIVKSEVALNWGGKALWLIQDNLAEYISASTALDLRKFVNQNLSEVNVLSFGYGKPKEDTFGIIELEPQFLFSGPISANEAQAKPSFSDLIRISFKPPIKELIMNLAKHKCLNKIKVQ
jgi:hypothetical protein